MSMEMRERFRVATQHMKRKLDQMGTLKPPLSVRPQSQTPSNEDVSEENSHNSAPEDD